MPLIRFVVAGMVVALLLVAGPSRAQTPLSAPIAAIRDALRAGALESAIEHGESAVESLPENALAWFWLGQAYGAQARVANILMKAKWAGRCRDAFERSVALDPRNPEALFGLMQFYAMAPGIAGGDADRARELAGQIAKVDPVWGHLAGGQLALTLDEDKAAAERAYRAGVDADPDSDRATQALASLYASEKRFGDARALWQSRLARRAGDAYAIYAIGRLAAISGEDLDNGLAMLDRYLTLPDKPPEIGEAPAHWRRGLVLDHLGRRDEAVAAIRKGLALDPAMAEAKKDLGRLLD